VASPQQTCVWVCACSRGEIEAAGVRHIFVRICLHLVHVLFRLGSDALAVGRRRKKEGGKEGGRGDLA